MSVSTGVLGSHDLVATLGRLVAIVGDDGSLVLRTHRVRHLQRQRRPLQHRIPAASPQHPCCICAASVSTGTSPSPIRSTTIARWLRASWRGCWPSSGPYLHYYHTCLSSLRIPDCPLPTGTCRYFTGNSNYIVGVRIQTCDVLKSYTGVHCLQVL